MAIGGYQQITSLATRALSLETQDDPSKGSLYATALQSLIAANPAMLNDDTTAIEIADQLNSILGQEKEIAGILNGPVDTAIVENLNFILIPTLRNAKANLTIHVDEWLAGSKPTDLESVTAVSSDKQSILTGSPTTSGWNFGSNFQAVAAGAQVSSPFLVGSTVGYVASTPSTGTELWSITGGQATLLRDIDPGPDSSSPTGVTLVGSTEYFAADDGSGAELWKTNGTSAGTIQVADIAQSGGSDPENLTPFGSQLLFSADDGVSGRELWISNGSSDTHLVADINPGPGGSNPQSLAVVGTTAFFDADDGQHGLELWKTNGKADGTKLVKDINPGARGSAPFGIVGAGTSAFFGADDGIHGSVLWTSDGSAHGTHLVADINPGPSGADLLSLTSSNGKVFFEADDGVHGMELWVSNGTADGTKMVKDINPGAGSSFVDGIVDVSGIVFFHATDGVHGQELWRSDGTDAGTYMVQDIDPGPGGSNPSHFTLIHGQVYFYASDGTDFNLYTTDGSTVSLVEPKVDSTSPILGLEQPEPDVPYRNGLTAVLNGTTYVGDTATLYDGPVAGIQKQYINTTNGNLNVTTSTDNWFIHSGSGFDGIDVSHGGGVNVLDGGTNSNFLVGGTGATSSDTFFVDDRGPSSDIWSTVVNFHAGDAATIFGVTQQGFTTTWVDGQAAAGYTGLTLHEAAPGVPTASITLSGYSMADLSNGRLSTSWGKEADGTPYLYIHGNT
jgi:ELWxxDGT repeat protein